MSEMTLTLEALDQLDLRIGSEFEGEVTLSAKEATEVFNLARRALEHDARRVEPMESLISRSSLGAPFAEPDDDGLNVAIEAIRALEQPDPTGEITEARLSGLGSAFGVSPELFLNLLPLPGLTEAEIALARVKLLRAGPSITDVPEWFLTLLSSRDKALFLSKLLATREQAAYQRGREEAENSEAIKRALSAEFCRARESAQGGWVAVVQDAYDSLTDGDAEGAIKKLRSLLPPPPSDPSKGGEQP